MSIKAEQVLDQLRGLETFLEKGRLDEARSAIGGIRHMLLMATVEEEYSVAGRLDDKTLAALIAGAKSTLLLKGTAISGAPGRSEFDDSFICWGWYDTQTDSAKRRYRWCGGASEAGLILPFRPTDSVAIVLSLRPLLPDTFGTRSLEMTVNGRPSPVRLLGEPGDRIFHLIVEPQSVKTNGMVEIAFYPRQAEVPAKAGLTSGDRRKLSFNVFEFIWLPRG